MAARTPHAVDIDPDFEPQKRPRSCTWPPPRPESSGASRPGTNDADVIPEEEDDDEEEEDEEVRRRRRQSAPSGKEEQQEEEDSSTSVPPTSSSTSSSSSCSAAAAAAAAPPQQLRKTSARRNAWGSASYAELISQAIEGAPQSRLTLAQIYDWMVRTVPYFRDKGDSNSSAGWKNSIRHNLSLHSRFVKVQNEGTGKSSWWMVNPEGGKGGKAPRRRAVSMDNSKYIKGARGRATKKKASLQAAPDGSSGSSSSLSKWTGSPTSRSSDELDAWTDFRSRTNSNASTLSGRLSPILANLEQDEVADDDDDDSPLSPMLFSSPSSMSPSAAAAAPPLSDLAGTMNLNDGLSDNPMDDLLDNISLAASQQPPPGEEEEEEDGGGGGADGAPAGSVFTFGCAGAGLGSPSLFSPPSITSLRQSPMQTIQENKQTTFSCGPLFGDAALQDLLGLDGHGHANVMLTQSDPLMSQASAALTLQNSRRNALLLRKQQDPPLSILAGLPTPANGRLGLSAADADAGAADAKHRRLQKSPVKTVSMQLGAAPPPPPSPLLNRFPADLDLDVFNGDLECDMDAIIRNELMEADCLDLSFESQTHNAERSAGSFSGAKQTSPQRWVPS
ncbi:unnamed protein product [Merluccius merluccius]